MLTTDNLDPHPSDIYRSRTLGSIFFANNTGGLGGGGRWEMEMEMEMRINFKVKDWIKS